MTLFTDNDLASVTAYTLCMQRSGQRSCEPEDTGSSIFVKISSNLLCDKKTATYMSMSDYRKGVDKQQPNSESFGNSLHHDTLAINRTDI